MDIFENTILCKNCNVKMHRATLVKNGFQFRAIICTRCGEKILHPEDKAEYHHYLNLKNKSFSVKLRMVGNSYTVSIPREIVNFINEQNNIMDEIVRLNFDQMGKLSIIFDSIMKKQRSYEDGKGND
ncbi:hypothetical protein J4463_03450 [Candidatus Pacearchaeota archaeon]|nr:hypothetical protein [Candidatus Pacearchaeota archaeon]